MKEMIGMFYEEDQNEPSRPFIFRYKDKEQLSEFFMKQTSMDEDIIDEEGGLIIVVEGEENDQESFCDAYVYGSGVYLLLTNITREG